MNSNNNSINSDNSNKVILTNKIAINHYNDSENEYINKNTLSPMILQDKELFKKKNSINRIPQNNRFHSNSISTVYDNNKPLTETTEYSKTKHSSLQDQNYTINNSTKNNSNISYNEKNQSLVHIKEEHKIMKTETNNMIYNINSIMNNNNTNENNIAYNNNMVFISIINNISSLNNTVITTNNNINNNFIIQNNNINNNSMIAINNNIYISNTTTITISTPLNHIHTTVSSSLPPTSYTIHSLSNLYNTIFLYDFRISFFMPVPTFSSKSIITSTTTDNPITAITTATTIITTSSTIYSYYKTKRSHTIYLSPIQSLPSSLSPLLVATTIITISSNSRLTIKTNFYNNNNNNNMNINDNEGVTYPISPSFLSSTDIHKDISNINDIIDVKTTANNNSNNNKNIKNDEND
ncbi:hypothetical protein WA158_004447 [Blastocystis sp. Blastoise]